MQEKIGYIVWGVQKEFQNNLLSGNVHPDFLALLTNSLSYVCVGLESKFFTIEKMDKVSLLSIVDPKSLENTWQKDYIVISLVLPIGYCIKGDVIN